jgi:hypothetical protein
MPAKQLSLVEDDKADPQVAKTADRYIEAKKEKESAVERMEKLSGELVRQLKKLGKTRVRHGETIIELSHKAEAETIKLKKAKAAPVKKFAKEIRAPVN